MKLFKIVVLVLAVSLFQGCSGEIEARAIATSKKVMKNRETFAKDIMQATNECIKSATSVKNLTAASNDQAETVEECTKSAQKAYGAYSPYDENFLQEWAAQ